MPVDENVSSFSIRIWNLAATLRTIGVILETSDMAMALLGVFPECFDGPMSALDALENDG